MVHLHLLPQPGEPQNGGGLPQPGIGGGGAPQPGGLGGGGSGGRNPPYGNPPRNPIPYPPNPLEETFAKASESLIKTLVKEGMLKSSKVTFRTFSGDPEGLHLAPNVGPEPKTLGLRVPCSTD